VRPVCIILDPPSLDDRPGLCPVCEYLSVQTLVSHLAVEALDIRVLPRTSRLYVDRLAAEIGKPLLDCFGDELGTVVAS